MLCTEHLRNRFDRRAGLARVTNHVRKKATLHEVKHIEGRCDILQQLVLARRANFVGATEDLVDPFARVAAPQCVIAVGLEQVLTRFA